MTVTAVLAHQVACPPQPLHRIGGTTALAQSTEQRSDHAFGRLGGIGEQIRDLGRVVAAEDLAQACGGRRIPFDDQLDAWYRREKVKSELCETLIGGAAPHRVDRHRATFDATSHEPINVIGNHAIAGRDSRLHRHHFGESVPRVPPGVPVTIGTFVQRVDSLNATALAQVRGEEGIDSPPGVRGGGGGLGTHARYPQQRTERARSRLGVVEEGVSSARILLDVVYDARVR